jgi:ribosomal protein S27AE
MTHINEKLGLRPGGKRSMMKLPADRALRNRVTSAICPECQRTGAILAPTREHPHRLFCGWCSHRWELPPA